MILCKEFSRRLACSVVLVLFGLLVFASCNKSDAINDSIPISEESIEESVSDSQEETAPTGLSEGMITPPQIMYQGVIYEYRFMGKRDGLPNGFTEVGTILSVNDYEIPSQDFYVGGRELKLAVEQQVFASESDNSRIAVLCDEGYYMFYNKDSK